MTLRAVVSAIHVQVLTAAREKPLHKAAIIFILEHLTQSCQVPCVAIYVKSIIRSAEKPGKLTCAAPWAPEANVFLVSEVAPVSSWRIVEGNWTRHLDCGLLGEGLSLDMLLQCFYKHRALVVGGILSSCWRSREKTSSNSSRGLLLLVVSQRSHPSSMDKRDCVLDQRWPVSHQHGVAELL